MSYIPSNISREELEAYRKQKKQSVLNKTVQQQRDIQLFGTTVSCVHGIKILVGPVIGKVTQTTAIVLVEIDMISDVTIYLVSRTDGSVVTQTKRFIGYLPATFYLENLVPGTTYDVCFGGVGSSYAKTRVGRLRTLPTDLSKLRVVALSCDRPERHLEGEKLMWKELWNKVANDEVDLVLHLGDQVYAQKEAVDASAIFRHSDHDDHEDQKTRIKRLLQLASMARNRLCDVYRFTWNLPYTAKCLANVPHLMIWSDNDIYNDFTIATDVPPVLVQLGQEVYRLYQRALWDEDIKDDSHHTEEQHFHKYGSLGIMMIDMRGNRIDVHGNQFPENPIVSDNQWSQIEALVNDPEVTQLLVCSEIPFVSDPPDVIKKGVAKVPFLVDHWGYNDKELFRLLDLLSDWKKNGDGKKDFVLVGGDIHVGGWAYIHDKQNDIDFRQVTTSPITNHVCDFFPKLENDLSERYSYRHVPLPHQKNYALFEVENGGPTFSVCQLIGSDSVNNV